MHALRVYPATEWVQQSHSASAASLITSSVPDRLLTHARPSPICSLSAAVPRDWDNPIASGLSLKPRQILALDMCVCLKKNIKSSRSTIGGVGDIENFAPVLGGDATKIAPPGDMFDQSAGEMSSFRGKLANHVGNHVVLSPEEVVLITSPGMESSYPRPPPNR